MQMMTLQALEQLRDTFARHNVRYLVIGKGAALLHGFPDTTQDADLFIQKTKENAQAVNQLEYRVASVCRADRHNRIVQACASVGMRFVPGAGRSAGEGEAVVARVISTATLAPTTSEELPRHAKTCYM